MKTKVASIKLLSNTEHPIATVYCQWLQSRTLDPVPTPAEVVARIEREQNEIIARERYESNPKGTPGPFETEVYDVFEKVIAMKMPLAETLDFVFLLENISVAFREQLVRHRIGHKFGEKIGADIIPDLAGSSSFWSQTTRIIDMGQFAINGEYLVPYWMEENGEKKVPGKIRETYGPPDEKGQRELISEQVSVSDYYETAMRAIQEFYNGLVSAGMPLEDARNVLPVAMQHRMTWKVNLLSLMNVLSRRGCWLAQLGMWEPIIKGIVEELATKVHPSFRRLIDPPCFDQSGNYAGCAFGRENEEIVPKGEYPPCSLWVNHEGITILKEKVNPPTTDQEMETDLVNAQRMPRYEKMMARYTALWHRDPRTGERKQVG